MRTTTVVACASCGLRVAVGSRTAHPHTRGSLPIWGPGGGRMAPPTTAAGGMSRAMAPDVVGPRAQARSTVVECTHLSVRSGRNDDDPYLYSTQTNVASHA